MDNKFFGIGSTYRSTIPDAKRATGFGATQEPFEYINQALFELKCDHIIGTAAQLALGQCTCKYQSSDQTLRDSSGTAVTLTDGDRVCIIGLDTLTADFDLSAYDRLRVTVDPSISLGNGSQNLIFGDESVLDIHCADQSNVTVGTGCRGHINHTMTVDDIEIYNGKGLDFTESGKWFFRGLSAVIWRMANNESVGDQNPLGAGGSDWEQADDTENEFYQGPSSQISESSGVFTFGEPGVYLIFFFGRMANSTNSEPLCSLDLYSCDDFTGTTTYSLVSSAPTGVNGALSGTPRTGCFGASILRVNDIAECRVKLAQETSHANTYTEGSGTNTITGICFFKLSDLT